MSRPEGVRYEIAIDGTPRTYRDTIEGAWAAATNLKTKQCGSHRARSSDRQGDSDQASPSST
jgi:hypothetical protein